MHNPLSHAHARTSTPRFVGETMTCTVCGRQERSDPSVESDWRCIEVDGQGYYVCPNEFPPDTASAKDFEKAYRRVLEHIIVTHNLHA